MAAASLDMFDLTFYRILHHYRLGHYQYQPLSLTDVPNGKLLEMSLCLRFSEARTGSAQQQYSLLNAKLQMYCTIVGHVITKSS